MALGKLEAALDELTGGAESKIQLDTTLAAAYSAGLLHYDATYGVIKADMGVANVRAHVGVDVMIPVHNGTGSLITKGTPVSGDGSFFEGRTEGIPADADNIISITNFIGIAVEDIEDTEVGWVVHDGGVLNVDTSAYEEANIYLKSGGGITNDIPSYPTYRLQLGGILYSHETEGIIGVSSIYIPHYVSIKDYTVVTGATGDHYVAGFYDWASTSVELTQASLTQTYGTSGRTKAAHVGIVPEAAGTVDTGQVGLKVTGTLDSETGAQVATQTLDITDDITTLTADVMAETVGKFSGQVTFELYIVSGTPTAYSLTFNYGFSKYEDSANKNFTFNSFECLWEGGSTETGMDISFMWHKAVGWTYAASGFVAGNGAIAQRSVDQAIESTVASGAQGSYKRVNIQQAIAGGSNEGLIIKLTTTSTNSIANMNIHIALINEELAY